MENMTKSKEIFAQITLSNKLSNMKDQALASFLRKVLFANDQNWEQLFNDMVDKMPELQNEYENVKAIEDNAKVTSKLTGEVIPYVGMGAIISCGSDCYPYEVVEIKTAKKIVIRSVDSKRIDNNGLSEDQEYEYTSNPNGVTYVVTLRSDKRWKIEKTTEIVKLGYMCRYIDPHF